METRPWSRWWWHGNAVTEAGITAELEAYKRAGIGGLELTHLAYMAMKISLWNSCRRVGWSSFGRTLREADRLDLGIDMATGTGWLFGGPWIKEADACKNMNYKQYTAGEGNASKKRLNTYRNPLYAQ